MLGLSAPLEGVRAPDRLTGAAVGGCWRPTSGSPQGLGLPSLKSHKRCLDRRLTGRDDAPPMKPPSLPAKMQGLSKRGFTVPVKRPLSFSERVFMLVKL